MTSQEKRADAKRLVGCFVPKEKEMENKSVYWDSEKKMFYWIEWEDIGNGEIPHRHYIHVATPVI